jgi:hypothetical protein
MVGSDGTVHLFSNVPFAGTALIYGGMYPMVPTGLLVNPMEEDGDMIFSTNGMAERLPIGEIDQVLTVGSNYLPAYKTLGTAAWKGINIPGGVPLLDEDGQIPPEFLPFFTMTYKGTFGSPNSSTRGDLPTEGVLDGDIYVCDSDYSSSVAGKSFSAGQWAIFNGTSWDVIPLPQQPDSVPVGSVISYAGSNVPANYMACNGYVLDRELYANLFSAIGTTYNSGGESAGQFRIPNYNNEKRFLQAATVAGKKTEAGLPNITGSFGSVAANATGTPVTGAFYYGSHMNNIKWLHDDAQEVIFNASRSNAIYGRSSTVQPPAQDVIFLIKFQ